MCIYECVCVHRKRRAGCKEKEDADATLGFLLGILVHCRVLTILESLPTTPSKSIELCTLE